MTTVTDKFRGAVHKLLEIAANGERGSLIDTPSEWEKARHFLYSEFLDLRQNPPLGFFENRRAQQVMDAFPHALNSLNWRRDSFQINLAPTRNLPLCSHKRIKDCYQLLIPVPSKYYAAFPVHSGGMFRDLTDYVPVTKREWSAIVQPLTQSSGTDDEERRKLGLAAANFDRNIASDSDWGGWVGNFISVRGEQDCTEEVSTNVGFLHILSAERYLRYHHFNFNHMVEGHRTHVANVFQRKDGVKYTLDTWRGIPEIMALERWRVAYPRQRITIK